MQIPNTAAAARRSSIHIPTYLKMITPLFYLIFLLTSPIIGAPDQGYIPTDHILLNCGADSTMVTLDGQGWDGDADTKLSPDISTPSLSSPATATKQDPSITSPVPYLTARIIHSKFSYIFPLSSGQKILRLYFYPATYFTESQSFDKTQSFFGVTANQYTLLTNFSASLTASGQDSSGAFFVKEFIVNVQETQALNVTFLPSPNSYAFINGIEVVSVPADFYMGSHNLNSNPLRFVNSPNYPYGFDQNVTAFQTLYRLNVGGQAITGEGDTGMFRDWLQDDRFLSGWIGNPLGNDDITINYTSQTPIFSAPEKVYRTARAMDMMANQTPSVNLTWSFQVDTGFFYLFRLHFCEFIPSLIFTEGQKIFSIFINNMTAEDDVDIIHLAGGNGIPLFRDYVISVGNPTGAEQSKYNLFLALAPARQFGPKYLDASLNGLEIFKLNTTTSNLAGVNPDILQDPQQSGKKKSSVGILGGVVGGVAGGGAIIFLLILFTRQRIGTKDFDRKSATKSSWPSLSTQSKSTNSTLTDGSSPLPSDLCRRFLLEEIKTATSNFDPALVIGAGGFGNVYRGCIDQDLTAVAIKRSDPCSNQGFHEFRTEIEMLSRLRHIHLVSLIGYCDDASEMILVYDYMPNGTLRDHLYRTENPPLTWKQRLEICIGAARGLHYLHNEANQVVIHRDIKSNNILLDENWVAKISDFGLSKMGAPDESFIHFSTNVKGTFGYLDPEYFSTKKLTRKSDVYAFGVVLFEVLSGRPAVDTRLDEEQHSLATWARSCIRNNQVDELIDSNLEGQISPACLRLFVGVARRCIDTHPPERPPMADVVVSLEMALVLQQNPSSAQQADEEDNIYVFT